MATWESDRTLCPDLLKHITQVDEKAREKKTVMKTFWKTKSYSLKLEHDESHNQERYLHR